jgi:hypothetical protein
VNAGLSLTGLAISGCFAANNVQNEASSLVELVQGEASIGPYGYDRGQYGCAIGSDLKRFVECHARSPDQ